MPSPRSTGQSAWSDESFQEKDSAGFYVIAAAVVDSDALQDARELMQSLRGRRNTAKSHWTEMDARQKVRAAQCVAGIDGVHVVTIGSPVPPRKQERARSKCLSRLVAELYSLGVDRLFMEAREAQLNKRDIQTVQSARFVLPKGADFRIEHVHGGQEPLLWVADVVAGACRARQLGEDAYWAALHAVVLEVEVPTDCR
ncbi:hypothetical protein SL103_34265 [Streptomyces lydicus]|uniref:DUF3800 domain-containing protein n=1 Tax=Streptomyces lydicus TaxID=47763 RepID=A0A1D7VY43_9ACTN|nr:hypothetical protein SL103_34175 [Streptomyces lydicus]AOP51687.1 hypothetical protein SL103_34265 [Streptomyces lydicus]